jgi:hypothetical protein
MRTSGPTLCPRGRCSSLKATIPKEREPSRRLLMCLPVGSFGAERGMRAPIAACLSVLARKNRGGERTMVQTTRNEPVSDGSTVVAAAQDLLRRHAHFRGRADRLGFTFADDALIVTGVVPSFYMRQVLQTMLRELGEVRIENLVEVVSSSGLSTCSKTTRERCTLERRLFNKTPNCVATCDIWEDK